MCTVFQHGGPDVPPGLDKHVMVPFQGRVALPQVPLTWSTGTHVFYGVFLGVVRWNEH